MTDVTRILSDIERGDPKAAEQLLPLVYDELRALAAQKLVSEKPGSDAPGHNMAPRGLHEARRGCWWYTPLESPPPGAGQPLHRVWRGKLGHRQSTKYESRPFPDHVPGSSRSLQ